MPNVVRCRRRFVNTKRPPARGSTPNCSPAASARPSKARRRSTGSVHTKIRTWAGSSAHLQDVEHGAERFSDHRLAEPHAVSPPATRSRGQSECRGRSRADQLHEGRGPSRARPFTAPPAAASASTSLRQRAQVGPPDALTPRRPEEAEAFSYRLQGWLQGLLRKVQRKMITSGIRSMASDVISVHLAPSASAPTLARRRFPARTGCPT